MLRLPHTPAETRKKNKTLMRRILCHLYLLFIGHVFKNLSNRLLSLPCILLRNLMFDIWKLKTYTAQGLETLIQTREIVLSSTHTIVSYDEERISNISLIKKACLCFWYQCSCIYFPEFCAIFAVLIEK